MAKEIAVKIKLQAPGGQATPAPPIGPALGQAHCRGVYAVAVFLCQGKDLLAPLFADSTLMLVGQHH